MDQLTQAFYDNLEKELPQNIKQIHQKKDNINQYLKELTETIRLTQMLNSLEKTQMLKEIYTTLDICKKDFLEKKQQLINLYKQRTKNDST